MMGPFPYFPLAFTKDGKIVDQAQFAAVISAVASDALTDLIVISHGWNDDMPEAEALYTSIFGQVAVVLPLNNPACDAVRARNVAVVGILWPSKKFDDSSLIPGGAAALDDGRVGATQSVDRLSAFLDSPDASPALERAKSLIPQLGDSMDARDEFGRLIRAFMPHDANDEEPVIDPSLFTLTGDELLRRLARGVPDVGPSTSGGAASLGGAAGFGDWFGKVADGARNLANLVTYYQMKNRAGAIGQGGVRDVLERIRNDRPASGPKALAIHLVGHSFGCRLVTAAAAGPEGAPPLPVNSLVLLQAAFSHYGFALAYDGTHDGFFRRVVTDPAYVTGVVAITFTAKDKAVGLAYPIASRIARQIAAAIGDAGDPYGGLGRNGAQKTPGVKTVTLAAPGAAYGFAARGIYNLDSNQTIGGHSDLAHPEVAYALLSAMGTAEP
jgi:pimeloyl-ACP methyl ester carboxylesterase